MSRIERIRRLDPKLFEKRTRRFSETRLQYMCRMGVVWPQSEMVHDERMDVLDLMSLTSMRPPNVATHKMPSLVPWTAETPSDVGDAISYFSPWCTRWIAPSRHTRMNERSHPCPMYATDARHTGTGSIGLMSRTVALSVNETVLRRDFLPSGEETRAISESDPFTNDNLSTRLFLGSVMDLFLFFSHTEMILSHFSVHATRACETCT